MTTLTQCQQQVLDMLISYQKERGFPPTNQEVATMLGYRSVNAAVEHLRALEKKGVITIKRGVARGITLHTAVKDDDSEAVGIIRSLLAGEENARLRAAHWLHERGLKSAAYAAIVEQLRRLPKPTSAPASVEIVLFPPDNRIRDLDNYNKALFDALTHAGVWEDDSQVKRMLVEWGPVIPEGKVEITISKYEKTAGAAA
ncbi:hypothetical protein BXT95_14770 [Escherichia coli]|nr:hypothetical protein BXT95_14770 [Escherichia coli]